MQTGLQVCLNEPPAVMRGARLGLLLNQASVDAKYRYACDLIDASFPGQLVSLFSPQHGLWCQQQANMIESDDDVYRPLNLPIHSLYSETRRPTNQWLSEIDCLVIDLQDVGTRVYTFIWTLLECLRACADRGVSVVVLDRPNPLGGAVVEGPLLSADHLSFVGGTPMPMRHGMTIGEIALWLNACAGSSDCPSNGQGDQASGEIGADLTVVPMQGWNREDLFAATGLPWVAPSPNMPTLATALVYPGQVLLEGVNLSEGRGTTQPFEICGAPGLGSDEFADRISQHDHPGVVLQPIRFRPTFDKWVDQDCHGVAIRIEDAGAVRSFRLTLSIIDAAIQIAPDEFRWLDPPYEYEYEKPPIDILYGSSQLREQLRPGSPLSTGQLNNLSVVNAEAWFQSIAEFLIY